MTEQTLAVQAASDTASEHSGLAEALGEICEDGGPRTDGDFSALGMLLIDQTLAGDEDALRDLQQWLGHELAQLNRDEGGDAETQGRLRGLLDVSHWAIARALPLSEIQAVEPGSHKERFLKALASDPGISNRELVESLQIDESQVSRLGGQLREQGLIVSQRIGRRNRLELSPKGIRVLDAICGVSTAENLAKEARDDESHVESREEVGVVFDFMASLTDRILHQSGAFERRSRIFPRVDTDWALVASVRDSGAQLLQADLSAEGKKNLAAVTSELRRIDLSAKSSH